jgi:Spy/CpxP family protein refolding chaperone
MKKGYIVLGMLAVMVLTSAVFAFGPGGQAGCAPGQAGGGPGWQNGHGGHGRMASELNLSKEQQDQLAALRKQQWEGLRPLRDQMSQKQQEMRSLYTDPAAKDATIIAKQNELNALRQQMQDRTVQFRLEQRKIFTPEQLAKLKDMPIGYGRGSHRGHGPGCGNGQG